VTGEELPILVFMIGAMGWTVGIAFWSHVRQARIHRQWKKAAEACGLRPHEGSTWITPRTHAQPDLRVRFEPWVDGDTVRGRRVSVDSVDLGLVGLTLRPESRPTARAKPRGARDIETGDESFDDAFYVAGPTVAVRAVLSAPTRERLLSLLIEPGLEVVDGELRAHIPWTFPAIALAEPLLLRTLRLLLEAAHGLRPPADLAAALAANARSDPEPSVRTQNLLDLVRKYPEAEATRAALRAACADPSDDVRVRAATALGDEGCDVLLDVARLAHADDGPVARAVTTLGDRLPSDDARSILARALRTRRLETARVCLHRLARGRDASAVPVMASVLAVEKGELAVAAAQALAETGLPTAEGPLLAALTRDVPDVRVAAASALGRVGSVEAVLPLKEVETRYHDEATRRAARQGVAAIQSRLPGASPGQLSLAPADAGALSIAEDETGRLSLDEERKR
jgi:HEAT repeat protein